MTVTDDDGHEETQVITLTVDPVNDPGSFSGDTSGTGAEDDSSLTGTLTFTDAIDGDSAPNYTVTSAASNGKRIDASGAWTYAPNEHFNGSDSFTVKVTDDDGHEETQVITLTVDPVNDAGAFSGDTSGTGAEDEDDITGTLTFADSIDGDTALTFTVSSDASNGKRIRRRQWCVDVCRMSTSTADSFTVTVTDDDGHEETQVITLTVDPVNDLVLSLVTLQAQVQKTMKTGTLTFTDAIDGDSAPNYTVSSEHPMVLPRSIRLVRGHTYRTNTSTAQIPLL